MSNISAYGQAVAGQIRWDGVQYATYIRQAAAVADALLNSTELVSNFKTQYDMSSDLLDIAEEQQNLLKNYYWPKELTFLEEFCTPEEVEDVNVYGRRYAGHLMASIAKAFAQKIKALKCTFGRYHTGYRAITLQSVYQAQATAIANAKVLGYMKAFAWVQARNNRNDKRRVQAIALGRKLMQQAAALYKEAISGLSAVNGNALASISHDIQAFKFAPDWAGDEMKDAQAMSERSQAAKLAQDDLANIRQSIEDTTIPAITDVTANMWNNMNLGSSGSSQGIVLGASNYSINNGVSTTFSSSTDAGTNSGLYSVGELSDTAGTDPIVSSAIYTIGSGINTDAQNYNGPGNEALVNTGQTVIGVTGGQGIVIIDHDNINKSNLAYGDNLYTSVTKIGGAS